MVVVGGFADSLMLEPQDSVLEVATDTKVKVNVEVVPASGVSTFYSVDVPKGSTLLEALRLLRDKSDNFT